MKKSSPTSLKIIALFKKYPESNVKDVALKYNMALPYVYKLRAKSRLEEFKESFVPPVLPVPPLTLTVPPQMEGTISVGEVLDQRAVDYGQFKNGAELMQAMKRLIADHAQKHGKTFADDQWEALEMIIHKIGRIINGNPDKVDHWIDIAGYAKLVALRLEGVAR
jgi:hypothetical protein